MVITSTRLARIRSLLGFMPALIAVVSMITGGVSLITTQRGAGPFIDSVDAWLLMSVGNAVGFIVAGALILVAARRESGVAVGASWILTLALASFGVAGIVEQPVVVPAGTDTVADSAGNATGFLLLALAIAGDRFRGDWARITSRGLAGLLFLISMTAILGYVYGAADLYRGFAGGSAMQLPAAVLFMLLAVAVVWLKPDVGFPAMLTEDTFIGAHVRSLLPMVFGAPLLVGGAVAAGYGTTYAGELAIVLTSLGSILAAATVGFLATINMQHAEGAMLVKDKALAATSNGVIITDHRQPDEPIIFVNDAFTEITGWPAVDAIGQNCRFLNQGLDNDPEIMDRIRSSIANGRECVVEFRNCRKDGSLFWNRLTLAPIEDHRGTVTNYVGIIDDFSALVEREERLEEALEAADSANKARETFVRLISHELRTPLNAALTWLRLMEVDDRAETRETGLATVLQSIESQSRLIDDLVDATRFASAGVRLEIEDVDIRELVGQVVSEMRPAAEPGVTLDLAVGDNAVPVRADRLRLQQIVRNLISNAIKFTPRQGTVTVTMDSRSDDYEISVSDTGRGMSADELDKVFELFWRGDPNTAGLGVGLTIVQALVNAHHGEISAESDGLGKGTTFRVRLPADGVGSGTVLLNQD